MSKEAKVFRNCFEWCFFYTECEEANKKIISSRGPVFTEAFFTLSAGVYFFIYCGRSNWCSFSQYFTRCSVVLHDTYYVDVTPPHILNLSVSELYVKLSVTVSELNRKTTVKYGTGHILNLNYRK
jgi:hypothetical protein